MLKDPVPKNVSKFPIHQTYLTDDAQPTGTGGYKFKAPEVWSSARSGKKSIAIRSIEYVDKRYYIAFNIIYKDQTSGTEATYRYSTYANNDSSIIDILGDLTTRFHESLPGLNLQTSFINNTVRFSIIPTTGNEVYELVLVSNMSVASDATYNPPEYFNIFFNQPKNDLRTFAFIQEYNNVWDRKTKLHFHASFIPFDNYQYLGDLGDKWNEPIIYQDANTSPLFNVWTTLDMKTPFPILHESFIIRITFIIATDSQYHS